MSLQNTPSELINREELLNLLRISNSTLFRLRQNSDSFPKPLTVFKRRVVWFREEINTWLRNRETAVPSC